MIAVGRIGRGAEADLFRRYAERLRPQLTVTEVAEGRGAPVEAKRRETDALLAAVPAGAHLVALDLGGDAPASEGFAAQLQRWHADGKRICFVIGGADGLGSALISRADAVLSLGPLTWPHMLVRVMLAEQLFRAQSILSGHPYHRSGRP